MDQDLSLIFFEHFIVCRSQCIWSHFRSSRRDNSRLRLQVMARKVVHFVTALTMTFGVSAWPLGKRPNLHKVFNSYVHGVEVNGLFNPMERKVLCNRLKLIGSITSQLFERASEEYGNPILSYQDICTPSEISI